MASKYFSERELSQLLEKRVVQISLLDIFRKEKYAKKLEELKEVLSKVKNGDSDLISQAITHLHKHSVRPPQLKRNFSLSTSDLNLQFTVHDGQNISVRYIATLYDQIPKTREVTNKKGQRTIVDRNVREINEEYVELLCIQVITICHSMVTLFPSLKRVYFSVYENRTHPLRGHSYDACILSVIFETELYDQIVLENLSPEAVLKNFSLRLEYDKNLELKEVVSPHTHIQSDMKSANIDLDGLSPIEFEHLIKDLLIKIGLNAQVTKASHDGGIDVVAVNDNPITGGRYVIQCKRYKTTIPVQMIRDLYGALTHEHASKGIFITTSDFSTDCEKFVIDKPLELINRKRLIQLLIENGIAVVL